MYNVEVFQTNDALGYREYAFLIKTTDGYLCIGLQKIEDGEAGYTIGEIVKDVDFVEPTAFKVEDSPLFNTYLFKHFLKSIK